MRVGSGGGFRAILYTIKKGREAGGVWKLYQALRTRNSCKTCAVGMGGQKGGMVNELGHAFEVCKKSMQAMAADMQPGIDPNFWKQNSIESLKRWSPRELETSGRLIHPLRYRAGASHYEVITWKEAFESIASHLRKITPDESFWYFSGRSSNEAGFLLQLLARVYGTNNVNNCSYYCHQASGVGLQTSVGSGTATIVLEDLEKADTVFLIGGNPASNHPRLMTSLMRVRRAGGHVIVINPVRETGLINFRIPSDPISLLKGTKIASHYVQPHIGGDLALLWGLAKATKQLGAFDEPFLGQHTTGLDQWQQSLDDLSWHEIETKSGVARSEIESIAKLYSQSKRTVFSWTMGITHHAHGVDNVQAIANLAFARGMVGREGCGLMPIRGHSNVQGIGSVGVTPKLKDQIFTALREQFGVNLPETPGKDTLECMEAAERGEIKVGFCLGGNLFGSNPDSTFADKAMSNLDLNVMMSTTLNTGHAHGLARETIVLPVLARDEEPSPTTQESMFNFVRLSDGGPARLPGPRSEISVIAAIGKRLLPDTPGIDWDDLAQPSTIRKWIGAVVPGYGKISQIDETKEEFQIEGRTFHEPTFGTPDGRGVLHCHSLPDLKGTESNQLRLMTVRSEGQFNTVVYEEEDLYRNQERRDIILMHPDDLKRLGLSHDQKVTVRSDTGELNQILARGYDSIRSGNALMYYPESNVLVSRHADPQSKTPAFKGVVVEVIAE
ncbi:FdhF/YdeP family oxidoreductase [Roseiconus lacunae]|uniref:FdhF/YdeP family oxidoreductase n=1 Tax=Roseiconus lacunae TaxID=2605694 RepID=A0ABT7PNK3_9BACT|nr:FdhF/YdeP family oxidoreductase [Roseiconus lacunae]MDM4018088.1 FdhF/YdeP family oxidoreductase [Roseiconus lacunae]WRQ50785.1 FdhF/YdeP family oxidoreductase [Stieleria sp. HD01]